MPLTQEQFQKARESGFSTEQIIEFEKRRITEQPQQSISQPQISIQEQPQIPQQQPQEPFYKRMMQPSIFGPIGQAYQGIPESIRTRLQESGLFGPLGTKGGQQVVSAPYNIAKGITGFAQEQLKRIPKVKEAYQTPQALGMYGPLGVGAGYLMKPEQREKFATGTISELGGIYGGGKIYQGLFNFVSKFKNWLNPKNQIKLAEETRNNLMQQKDKIIEKYGDAYNRIIKQSNKQISIQEPLLNLIDESDDIVNTLKGNQEVSEALARGEPNAKRVMNIVNTFMEKPQEIQNLSLQEADGLVKYIKNLPGLRGKFASQYKGRQVDFTNAERVLNNFANDIKAQVLNQAPEMTMVNREYGTFMSNYKQIRGYLKWNNAVTNMKNIHKLDPAILDKFQQMLPQNLLKNVLQMNRTVRNAELLKRIGIRVGEGAALGATGYAIYKGGRR